MMLPIVRPHVLLSVISVGLMLSAEADSNCPLSCKCRWKDGKQTVECQMGALQAIPEQIDPDTQVLDLSQNQLQRLPARAFADVKLVHLQKLLLRACGLRAVDAEAFAELTNLVTLDLSENHLKTLPDAALRHTVALRELDLHGNIINIVPAELPKELTRLDLSRCKISSIDVRAFMRLKKLQYLKLDRNYLKTFQATLVKSLHNLHSIDLEENPWTCDCRLRELRTLLNKIFHKTSPTCYEPHRLQGKQFKDIKLDSFACPPQVLVTGKKAQGRAGGNITAWCPVAGLPTPVVSWFLGDVPINNASRVGAATAYIINEVSEERGSLLLLSGPVMKDSGATLRCVATNAAGAATASFTLAVDYSPNISNDQLIGLAVALVLGLIIALCVCIVVVRRRAAAARKKSRTLVLTFPNGGGSVVAARTPEEPKEQYESDEQDEQEDYTVTRLPTSRAGSLVTTLIDTGGDESEELLHRHTTCRPLTGVWPAQAIALLDSAAPENVMYSTTGRGPRHSLLPNFAPDYSSGWSCQFSTMPRSQRHDSAHLLPRSCTPEGVPMCPDFSRVTIPAPCPPPPPLSPSYATSHPATPHPMESCLVPPPPMQTLHTKLSRITARDSPDEGYQEGTDV